MANEFVAKNGLIAQNNSTVSGSLIVTQGITGSLEGTASYTSQALSSSYTLTASFVTTAQTASYVVTAQTASYVQNAISSSFALTASYLSGYVSPFPYTGSAQITGSLGVTGSVVATSFSGDGTNITGITSTNVSSKLFNYYNFT